ncbi:helix-turn-helix domain-containing protein [Paracoccus sp. (in: a-proteobacteria)]|uniref:helix-turn-helix domain-containing protein n=1 Tax=Paracoccus sp. TaxID=267 RepID=UPI003A897933
MSQVPAALPGYFLYGDKARDIGLDTLNIEELRERSSRHDWIIHPHHHPHHIQLMLFTKGGADTRIEGVALTPRAPALVVHPAGMVHGIRYLPGSEGMTITVAKTYAEALVRDQPQLLSALQSPAVWRLGDAFDQVAADFTQTLHETRTRDPGWAMAVRGRFLTILVRLHRLQHRLAQPARPRRDLQLAAGLRDLVEQDFRGEKQISAYARRLAVSPQRLNAACKSALGCPASQVLHDRLIVEARRLLAYTEMTVAEIGHDLGFDDPAYFNRFFARRAGQSPGAWRAAHSATWRVDG